MDAPPGSVSTPGIHARPQPRNLAGPSGLPDSGTFAHVQCSYGIEDPENYGAILASGPTRTSWGMAIAHVLPEVVRGVGLQASGPLARCLLLQRRHDGSARFVLARERAAGMERAAGRRIDRAGYIPLEDDGRRRSGSGRVDARNSERTPACTGVAGDDTGRRRASSTIRPRYITATRSLTCSTTRKVVGDEQYVRPSSSFSSSSRLMTWAWTETSNADTGSSQTMSSGSTDSARAMPIRWRCPR